MCESSRLTVKVKLNIIREKISDISQAVTSDIIIVMHIPVFLNQQFVIIADKLEKISPMC